ncbi:flagellar basal body L-ring protein FlgH [Photobacterium damselae]|uniref:flagellar basal body L-ring protein FlgH n=1 Tax=Photobacterium damselae TaxID=38293 RepID=UPI001F300975|nr:flagellar basal body L-ring protein FlgH [Photobacterium damselae]UKA04621.1 flagellar basal body L-ring protein FlgH [Photobacterium damselae subsp. damselae]
MNKLLPITILSASLLAGCATSQNVTQGDNLKPFEVGQIEYPSTLPANGSIYTSSQNSMMLGVGKAFNVGDIVIIKMQEQIDAQDSTKSKTSRKASSKSGLGFTIPTLIETPPSATFNLSHNQNVDGDGSTSQSHKLEGNIAATVTRVFPNGILEIKGVKEITLEHGTEVIAITGKIREQDISTTDNSVASSRIAGAKIYYKGRGDIYNRSQAGWLSNALTGKYWFF